MKKYFLSMLIIASSFVSCSDVLDKTPLDIISDEAVWNDEALIEAYLVQCYYHMSYFGNESVGTGWQGDAYFPAFVVNHVSDECLSLWRDWGEAMAGYNYKFGGLKIGGGLLEWWGYDPIRKINEFIEKVPDSPLSQELKDTRVAEARFLRAFSYFAMVKRYGGVPLILKAQQLTDPEEELFPKRDTEEAVYSFVISEIDEIVNDLPEETASTDLGRATKYAALALKSRVALYAASIAQYGKVQLDGVVEIPSEKAKNYYQISYDASKEIINSGKFALYNQDADKVTNFKNIFLVENNSEVIFAKRHDSSNGLITGGNGWAVDFFQCPRPQGWNRGNLDAPYLELVEEFEYMDGTSGKLNRTEVENGLWTMDELWGKKDPRFFATIYTQETPWKGSFVDYHNGLLLPDGTIMTKDSYNGVLCTGDQDLEGTCFGVMKYLDESHDNMGGTNAAWATSSQDFLIFRYAETLLNLAEAAYELGKKGEALDAINQIRERAGIASLKDISQDKIRHERKVELAFEGHRYWDVRRWRTATTELSRSFSGLRYILDYSSYMNGEKKYKLEILDNIDGSVSTPLFKEENYYLPITLSRTSSNPNMVENPGYE